MGWLRRLRGTVVWSKAEDGLDEEMRFHLDERTEQYVGQGLTRDDARYEALRRFGSVEDVAYCAVFLAAEEANYLTGQVLQPNGGWVMA